MKTTSQSTYQLNKGKIATFLIHAVFIGIAALISFVLFWPLGLLLSVFTIGLALAETGFEIDSNSWKYRKFNKLFGLKYGSWKPISSTGVFHLVLSIDKQTYKRLFPISPMLYSNTKSQSKSITYNLIFSQVDNEHILLYEFESYKTVLQVARYILATENFEVIDHIALKLEENRNKRNLR